MRLSLRLALFSAASALASPAAAQTATDLQGRIDQLEALVQAQSVQLDAQKKALEAQEAQLKAQQDALAALRVEALGELRAAGAPVPTVSATAAPAPAREAPVQLAQARPVAPDPTAPATVGEAPEPQEPVEVAALPEYAGVLTPPGQFIIEPAFRYVHGSTNRLVFRGVEIATGVQIGALEASDADQTTLSPSLALRFGLTNRLEIEAVAPYLDRRDRVTTVAQRQDEVSRSFSLEGRGIGDVEVGLRYQLNAARPGRPVFIANLRYKSTTGEGTYEIPRDEFGVSTRLATGSGFQSYQAGLSFLYPTDPAVLFGGLTYLYNAPDDINREVGGVLVGKVDPGDSIGVNAGFGFALNPQFSFSLGYEHAYVMRTVSYLGGTRQTSNSLQVGSFMFGWSLRLTPRVTLNNAYEIGVTSDAPDVSVVLRIPYRF